MVMLKVSCGVMAIITIIASVVEADLYGQAKEDGEDVRSFTGRARSTSPIDQQSCSDIFTRPLLHKGSILQEEILCVCP